MAASTPPSWSVGLEMQFYVLIAIATPWIARNPTWKVFLVWAGIGLAWRLGSTLGHAAAYQPPDAQFIYASQLPGTLDEFGFGISVAKLLHGGHLGYSPPRLAAWASSGIVLLSLACLTAIPEVDYWKSQISIVCWRPLACSGFCLCAGLSIMLPGMGLG
ncbi:MAG: hypothetical protein IPJ18_05600 [Betaproteobacteria bacterium]|nr:hypothetical protein [Betaproteobacteria bacterium]